MSERLIKLTRFFSMTSSPMEAATETKFDIKVDYRDEDDARKSNTSMRQKKRSTTLDDEK